ncbi:MAG: NAD(P)/FAD-dependent oxidoreductase [Halioglobus sp.]|nr:NAD(P)/FAD-dependent oxidoreductase [Halioglobus sp.]
MRKKIEHYDVVILGGGAAGLFCAAVAGARGRRVLVLEKANKVGKKILMSGGGRCNFTNLFIEPENFISANPHFCKSALSQYTQWDFIAMVDRHGIDYEERAHGQLFCQNSAQDILKMLVCECEQVDVAICSRCGVESIEVLDNPVSRFSVGFIQGPDKEKSHRSVVCQSLVVATGALSIPTLGGSGIGYDIAARFSLALTQRRAGLVPLMFSDAIKSLCDRLAGVALEVEACCNGQSFTENILFTHRGVSGPVILQISNYWSPGDTVSINLLPHLDVREWLLQSKRKHSQSLLRTLLTQKLPKALVAELQALWWSHEAEQKLGDYSDLRLDAVAGLLENWQLKPSGTEGYRTAEVTLGGVDTVGVSSRTMEANAHDGLFFIGEVLDVSGHLGGYNFQWAWSSGFCAGQYA